MSKGKASITVIFTILFFCSTFVQEKEITVYGYITDAQTNKPILFANILIVGTNFGAASDENGYYRIAGVPYNTYRIRASVIGYNSLTKTDIVVQAGKPAVVDFELTEEAIQLENVLPATTLLIIRSK